MLLRYLLGVGGFGEWYMFLTSTSSSFSGGESGTMSLLTTACRASVCAIVLWFWKYSFGACRWYLWGVGKSSEMSLYGDFSGDWGNRHVPKVSRTVGVYYEGWARIEDDSEPGRSQGGYISRRQLV